MVLMLLLLVALLAFSTARWYLDSATERCSFVSMSVSMVSSSGGGFSTAIYPWTDLAAPAQRSENSFISS